MNTNETLTLTETEAAEIQSENVAVERRSIHFDKMTPAELKAYALGIFAEEMTRTGDPAGPRGNSTTRLFVRLALRALRTARRQEKAAAIADTDAQLARLDALELKREQAIVKARSNGLDDMGPFELDRFVDNAFDMVTDLSMDGALIRIWTRLMLRAALIARAIRTEIYAGRHYGLLFDATARDLFQDRS